MKKELDKNAHLTVAEAGRKGGQTTAQKYPTEIRQLWGKKGGRPSKKRQQELVEPVDVKTD
jgi:general stress protein YciG